MAASYEVTDGTRILGTFSSQSKADALKKELKAQGVKARVRIVHEEPKGRKTKSAPDAPRKPVKAKKTARSNPVPKKAPKSPQKPKETPKTGKTVDANTPKDYKGPLIPADEIRDMFEQHVYCTDVETGVTSEVMIKYSTVSVMEKGRNGYDLKAVYAGSEVESDGKYLRVTYKGVDHWFVIHADEKVSAPFVVRRRPAVDYATCSIEQLADVLYQIQEVHVTNRRWYDRDAPHEPNPILSRDEILNAITTPEKAVALCDAYLHCYVSSYSEYWGGWDENTISYSDWKAIEKRLAGIRADANEYIARSVPAEPPAPVGKPKKGPFKKKPKTALEVRGEFYRKLGNVLSALGNDAIPISRSEFAVIDPQHIAIIQFKNYGQGSFFGLIDEPDSTKAIRLSDVASKMDSYFDGSLPIPARLKADATLEYVAPRVPNLYLHSLYRVDPNDFRTALNKAVKVVGKGYFKKTDKRWGSKDLISFYDDGYGNLMMRSESEVEGADGRSQYGVLSDIGDGCDLEGTSYYQVEYLRILADLMSLSDTNCQIELEKEYPMVAKMAINGFEVTMMIAPCATME